MHSWGDDTVDWEGINESARYIGENLRRWGRVGVRQYKEKYGTVRVYCGFGWRNLLNITHPGHISWNGRYPKWLIKVDHLIFSNIVPWFNWIIVPYQKWLYYFLYKQCVIKFPHLRDEILSCADYSEILKDLYDV